MHLGADAGPLWFKPEKFLDPNFNPEAYVNDLKRYVSLIAFRHLRESFNMCYLMTVKSKYLLLPCSGPS